MQENVNQPFTKKQLIFPIIAIGIFILLVGSASYAYFTQSIGGATGAANISNGNAVNPRGCSFVSSATHCNIASNTQFATNFTDNYVSFMEMQESFKNNRVATTSCSLNIAVNGNQGCMCSYSVHLAGINNVAYLTKNINTYTAITAKATSTNTSHSISETYLTNVGALVLNNTLTVATTGTAVRENITVVVNVYNRDRNQDYITGRKFVYYLAAYPVCTVGTDTAKYAFGDVGPSDATTYTSLKYPSTSTTAKVFAQYKWGKKSVCANVNSTLICVQGVDNTAYTTDALYGQALYDRYYALKRDCEAAGGTMTAPGTAAIPVVTCTLASDNVTIGCTNTREGGFCYATDSGNSRSCIINSSLVGTATCT